MNLLEGVAGVPDAGDASNGPVHFTELNWILI